MLCSNVTRLVSFTLVLFVIYTHSAVFVFARLCAYFRRVLLRQYLYSGFPQVLERGTYFSRPGESVKKTKVRESTKIS